jgi:CBS-domain-containing membrane protein
VTDRDIAIAVVAEGIDPDKLSVGEVVQAELVTGDSQASVAEIVELMERHGVRRIPIVDQRGELVGIVTADDLVGCVAREMAAAVNMLEQQRAGERPTGEAVASATAVDMLRHLADQSTALARMLSHEQRKELDLRRFR